MAINILYLLLMTGRVQYYKWCGLKVLMLCLMVSNVTLGQLLLILLHGAGARSLYVGLHYFTIQYRIPVGLSFTDCIEKYTDTKILYAMMLPQSCSVYSIPPKSILSLCNFNTWASTDVTYCT